MRRGGKGEQGLEEDETKAFDPALGVHHQREATQLIRPGHIYHDYTLDTDVVAGGSRGDGRVYQRLGNTQIELHISVITEI